MEAILWETANKLRKNIDAATYKHVVLGLIFLRYISSVSERRKSPTTKKKAAGAFHITPTASWEYLQAHTQNPAIGTIIDQAMADIEVNNPTLKGMLPKGYAGEHLDSANLGRLIQMVDKIALHERERSSDILGHIFEYFLGHFALEEGKKGGQFYTPRSVVQVLVRMLEPYQGSVMDPCCGSGGMFVQSEQFIRSHQGKLEDITLYGQESNLTTWKLCKMNLSIRNINNEQVKWNSEGSFLKDAHKGVQVDFIMANPPFNDKDWGGEHLCDDPRWQYGVPPTGNANFAWIQHFIHHLKPNGQAGFVLSKGSLTKGFQDGNIRKNIVEADIIDCIVNLPDKLFLNTKIPACIWIIDRNKTNGRFRKRKGEILFIDACKLGKMTTGNTRVLTQEDIGRIVTTYHQWREPQGKYQDESGFSQASTIEQVRHLDYIITPSRYVPIPQEENQAQALQEKIRTLSQQLQGQIEEEKALDHTIREILKEQEDKNPFA